MRNRPAAHLLAAWIPCEVCAYRCLTLRSGRQTGTLGKLQGSLGGGCGWPMALPSMRRVYLQRPTSTLTMLETA
jgi:hypothetical protein